MNNEILKGEWKELKGEIQKAWGKLTDNDLDQINGEATRLEGLLQQQYGHGVDETRKKVATIIGRYDNLTALGEWNIIKGEIQKAWGELTENEVDRINGSKTRLMGLLQKKYGHSREEAWTSVDKFLKNLA